MTDLNEMVSNQIVKDYFHYVKGHEVLQINNGKNDPDFQSYKRQRIQKLFSDLLEIKIK